MKSFPRDSKNKNGKRRTKRRTKRTSKEQKEKGQNSLDSKKVSTGPWERRGPNSRLERRSSPEEMSYRCVSIKERHVQDSDDLSMPAFAQELVDTNAWSKDEIEGLTIDVLSEHDVMP